MVDFDALKDKAEGLVGEHADEVKQGIDKAGDFVAGKFGHGDQVQGVQSTLSGLVDKIAREPAGVPRTRHSRFLTVAGVAARTAWRRQAMQGTTPAVAAAPGKSAGQRGDGGADPLG